MSKVTVRFEVLDLHPGRGKRRSCVYDETLAFQSPDPDPAIIPGAGKRYVELLKKWNGRGTALKCLCGKNRYEVRFYRVNP